MVRGKLSLAYIHQPSSIVLPPALLAGSPTPIAVLQSCIELTKLTELDGRDPLLRLINELSTLHEQDKKFHPFSQLFCKSLADQFGVTELAMRKLREANCWKELGEIGAE